MYMRSLWPSTTLPNPGTLLRDLERVIEAVSRSSGTDWRGTFPPLNVSRDEERFYVRALLPGIDPAKLQVSVERNKVTISGERAIEPEPAKNAASYHRQERTEGSFSRTITLDASIDSEAVSASYRDGVLTIALPLSSAARARMIPVKAS